MEGEALFSFAVYIIEVALRPAITTDCLVFKSRADEKLSHFDGMALGTQLNLIVAGRKNAACGAVHVFGFVIFY